MSTPVSSLPKGQQAARVREGLAVLETEDGELIGLVQLQPGSWCFTPTGYERLFTKLAEWQVRIDSLEGLIAGARDQPAAVKKPEPPYVYDAMPLLLALALGVLIGVGIAHIRRLLNPTR